MVEENDLTTGSGWLDRRVERRMRKRQLARMNDHEKLQYKIERRADRDRLTEQRLTKLASATRVALISGPILAPMAVAWTGQAGFAMKVIGWSFPAAIVYAAAYELTTAFCGWMYHEARKDGDTGIEYRAATWAFAFGSATQQWWHYSDQWSATPRSVTFSSMTIIGLIVWELYARLVHRRKLRDSKMRSKPLPRLGLVRWARFPRLSWSAWSEMVRTGDRDLDHAWSVVESRRTSRTGPRWWSKKPVHTEVGGWTSTDQLPPLPDQLVQRPKPELPPVPTDPDRTKPGPVVDSAPVESADPDEFEPTEVERRAIRYMVDNGIRINRRNVGEVIRTHDGFKEPINTTRAGQVAGWGRRQNPEDGMLRAV